MLTKKLNKKRLTELKQIFSFAYSPPHLFLVLFLARKGSGYKTYHFAPSFSSFYRALLSSPASICPDGNRSEDPTALAPTAAHTPSGTTLPSHTSGHSAGAGRGKGPRWFPSKSKRNKEMPNNNFKTRSLFGDKHRMSFNIMKVRLCLYKVKIN